MSEKHIMRLTKARVADAHRGVDIATNKGGWVLELREAKRSDEQNSALHGLIGQIMKQRTHHNGIKMDKALWKAVFLQALGEEIRFVPTLDGDGLFPLGLSTRDLPKGRFSELIEFVLAWAAREGLAIEHFDDRDPGLVKSQPGLVADA